MSRSDPSSFHVRLPAELRAMLQHAIASNENSLNREICDRLMRTFEPDPALQLAEVLRPLLSTMSEEDQARFVEIAAEAASILSKRQINRRPKSAE